MAALLRSGHNRVFEYGYSFVKVCAEELQENEEKTLFNSALAVRVAQANNDAWKDFTKSFEQKQKNTDRKQKKKKMTIEEHRAIARRLAGL
jgi:hypothetical protein